MSKKHTVEDTSWLTEEVRQKFNSKLVKSTRPDGCWLYDGPRFSTGHGYMVIKGKMKSAMRIAWAMIPGADPLIEGRHISHKWGRCSPMCVNPDHLIQTLAGARSIGVINERRKLAESRAPLTDDERREIIEMAVGEIQAARRLGLKWNKLRDKINAAVRHEIANYNLTDV